MYSLDMEVIMQIEQCTGEEIYFYTLNTLTSCYRFYRALSRTSTCTHMQSSSQRERGRERKREREREIARIYLDRGGWRLYLHLACTWCDLLLFFLNFCRALVPRLPLVLCNQILFESNFILLIRFTVFLRIPLPHP